MEYFSRKEVRNLNGPLSKLHSPRKKKLFFCLSNVWISSTVDLPGGNMLFLTSFSTIMCSMLELTYHSSTEREREREREREKGI